MNFWKRLRLIGSVVVFAISVLAIAIAVIRTTGSDNDRDTLLPHNHPAITTPSGTTGL